MTDNDERKTDNADERYNEYLNSLLAEEEKGERESSDSNDSKELDYEKDFLPHGYLYSVFVAYKELRDIIEKIGKEIEELRASIGLLGDKIDKSMQIELAKKESFMKKLEDEMDKIGRIAEQGGSYGIREGKESRLDKKIIEAYGKIAEKEEIYKCIDDKSSNKILQRIKTSMEEQISILKDKKGMMEERQRKITSRELAKKIKQFEKISKIEGKIEGLQKIKEKYDEPYDTSLGELNYYDLSLSELIKTKLTSSVKSGFIGIHIKAIKKKSVILEGASKLPGKLSNKICQKLKIDDLKTFFANQKGKVVGSMKNILIGSSEDDEEVEEEERERFQKRR